MTENQQQPETRESKRAIQLKTELIGMLGDVVELLERGRADGFVIAFTIPRNEAGENYIAPEFVTVSKSW